MRPRDVVTLIVLGALFGSSFAFIRVLSSTLSPAFVMAVRVALAATVLLAVARVRGHHVRFERPLGRWLVLGTLNAAVPFVLIAWAERHVTASFAAILIATLPLFTAVVATLWTREALGIRRSIGLLVGFVGVVILVGVGPEEVAGVGLVAILAVLGASLSYAVGNVFTERRFRGVPRLTLTIGNFSVAGLVLFPFALTARPSAPPDASTLAALAGLVLAATVVAYLLYFQLLERSGATTTASVAYLIPAFGAMGGTLFLSEPLTLGLLVGSATIAISIVLVTGVRIRRPSSRALAP